MELKKSWVYVSAILAVFSFLFAFTVVFFPSSLDELGLTGFATAGENTSARINLTIESGLLINFTIDSIDWGTGKVEGGLDNATLDTSQHLDESFGDGRNKSIGGNFSGAWQNTTDGLRIENIGNVNVSLSLLTGKDASQFIGGTSGGGPSYEFNLTNQLTGSCLDSDLSLGEYYPVNITEPGTVMCNNFSFRTGSNLLRLDVKLVIPRDSFVGYLEDNITAIAVQSA
jgi:hypothetical protein